jgi:hypothetical protein
MGAISEYYISLLEIITNEADVENHYNNNDSKQNV